MSMTDEEYASANARSKLLKAEAAFKKAKHYRGINDKTGERQFSELGDKLYAEAMSWLRR